MPSIWKYYHTAEFKELLAAYDKLTEQGAGISQNQIKNKFITNFSIILYYAKEAIKKLESRPQQSEEQNESVLEKILKIDPKSAFIFASDSIIGGIDTVSKEWDIQINDSYKIFDFSAAQLF